MEERKKRTKIKIKIKETKGVGKSIHTNRQEDIGRMTGKSKKISPESMSSAYFLTMRFAL